VHCIVGVRTDDALDLHELVRLCSALSAEDSVIQQAAEEISSGALRDDSAERGLVLVEHDLTRHVAPGEVAWQRNGYRMRLRRCAGSDLPRGCCARSARCGHPVVFAIEVDGAEHAKCGGGKRVTAGHRTGQCQCELVDPVGAARLGDALPTPLQNLLGQSLDVTRLKYRLLEHPVLLREPGARSNRVFDGAANRVRAQAIEQVSQQRQSPLIHSANTR